MLREYEYPILILTKNANVARDEYIEVMDPSNTYIQFSVCTPFDEVARVFEPGASNITERLQAIEKLTLEGFYTAARINPMFPIYPDGHYSVMESEVEPLRFFDWSLIGNLGDAGVGTVIAGFVRLSPFNLKWIRETTGKDLRYLFTGKFENNALFFSTEEKRHYYEKCRDMCDRHGMRFSICYDRDSAYDEFRYLWADQDDCCDGRLNVRGFGVTYDGFRGDMDNVSLGIT